MVMLLYFYYSIKLAMHVRLFIGKKHYDIVLLHVHVCGHVIFNMTTYKVHEYINVYLIIMLQYRYVYCRVHMPRFTSTNILFYYYFSFMNCLDYNSRLT